MPDAIKSQGFTIEIGDAGDSPAALTQIRGVTGFNGFDGQAAEIDVTTLDSTAKEILMGLQDFGSFGLDVNHLPDDPGQTEARAAKGTQTLKSFLATFSDGSTASFSAYVMANPVSGGVDAKVEGSLALRISGNVVFA